MEYRRLFPADAAALFRIRLRALEQAPASFLTTVEEARERGLASAESLLADESPYNVVFGAVAEAGSPVEGTPELAGMIGIHREKRPKLAHKARIWGVFVEAAYRGQGIGGRLLDLALEHARERMQVAAVYLSVESGNAAARRLYESRGFVRWGTEPKATRQDGRDLDEDHMVLLLEPAARA